ncbi:hypothetical protein [Bosea sp. 124]|uniref:hypothetical protein n=1 Tax=Bosea sp. 124 TaxID=2135642 RepID=UPI000D3BF0EF|nr:hypothetical protein [Bosea sp. 124]PTM40925.1 hypothetical protein C8D03_2458 [Bosea sp. 124]
MTARVGKAVVALFAFIAEGIEMEAGAMCLDGCLLVVGFAVQPVESIDQPSDDSLNAAACLKVDGGRLSQAAVARQNLRQALTHGCEQGRVTYEAKSVISELRSTHSMWNWQIRQLSEKALPGFIWEARSQAKAEPEDQFIWEAIAAEGERRLELQRIRRTGKGQWIAVLQIFKHEHIASMDEIFEEHRECEGERAAIETLKAMLVEHHDKVGPAMSIEAKTMPALEWALMNGRPL